MQCTIIKLEIHNFMSFEDDVINFSARPGITSVVGVNNDIPGAANGAGKSSGPLALFYCLYGKAAIKTKNKFLKNKYTNINEFSVTTTLKIDNVIFSIHRGADGSGDSFLKLNKHVDGNIIDITPSSISECEDAIVRMLNGLTADIFLKTVYLTPTLGTNFFTLSKVNKTEFLNLVSGTNKLFDINNKISKDINEINTDIRIIDSELITLSKANAVLQTKKTDFLTQQHESTLAFNEHATNLQNTIDALDLQIHTLTVEMEDLHSTSDEQKSAKQQIINQIQAVTLNANRLVVAERAIVNKNKHIDDVISHNKLLCDSVCEDCLPTVKNVLNLTTLSADRLVNEKLQSQITKAKAQCAIELATLQRQQTEVEQIIKDTLAKYNAAFDAKTKAERELDSTICRLQLIKDKHNEPSTEVFSDMIQANDIVISQKNMLKIDTIKRRQQLSILKFATDSDTVHKFVTSRFVNDINFYVSKYLNDMGVNYYCKFDNDFTYTFMTPGGEMSYDNFSSGEKMRLNIAMSFAFRKLLMTYLNIDVNVIILDEYLDSNLDALAIAGITTLLTDIKQNPFYNIYLISHRKEFLSGSIDNVMTVTKTNGISKVSFEDVSN